MSAAVDVGTPPAAPPRARLLPDRFRAWAGACAAVVVIVPLVVLVGWALGVESLKRIVPGLVAMNPLTAVAFVAAGLALWLVRPGPPRGGRRAAATGLAWIVIVVGAARLIALATPLDLGLDRLMFPGALGDNRIAPNTALCFVLAGLALALIDVEWRRGARPAQGLAIGAAAVASVALVGYAYSTRTLYGVSSYIPMALHTAGCFLALGTGVLLARPDRGVMAVVSADDAGGLLARRLLVVTAAAPIALGWLAVRGHRAGWYAEELAAALLVIGLAALFNGLVWLYARGLHRYERDRRGTQERVRQAEEKYHAVVEQSADGIYVLDGETKRVIESNPAFRRLLGYAPGEPFDLSVYDFVDHPRQSVDARIAETLAAGRGVYGERRYRRRDGTDVDVLANASVITYGGRRVLCTVVHDIGDRKRAEEAVRETNRQLEAAAASEREAHAALKRAQSHLVQSEKLAGLGQMVAGVAHEINNPLSFVANNVAVLQRDVAALRRVLELYGGADGVLAAHQPDLLAEIRELSERVDLPYLVANADELMRRSREGLRRIQQIVKDLRDFARLDESDLHEVDVNAGIESTVNIIRGNAKKRRVQIETDLSAIPPLACYPAKLNQVVMNLLSNAIDASPEGATVAVRSRQADGVVRIEVEDQGRGIPPDVRDRIFDPFFTTKPPGQGTGLGLSISYGIVRDHDGTIEVESEEGKGTRMTVALPVRRAAR